MEPTVNKNITYNPEPRDGNVIVGFIFVPDSLIKCIFAVIGQTARC